MVHFTIITFSAFLAFPHSFSFYFAHFFVVVVLSGFFVRLCSCPLFPFFPASLHWSLDLCDLTSGSAESLFARSSLSCRQENVYKFLYLVISFGDVISLVNFCRLHSAVMCNLFRFIATTSIVVYHSFCVWIHVCGRRIPSLTSFFTIPVLCLFVSKVILALFHSMLWSLCINSKKGGIVAYRKPKNRTRRSTKAAMQNLCLLWKPKTAKETAKPDRGNPNAYLSNVYLRALETGYRDIKTFSFSKDMKNKFY